MTNAAVWQISLNDPNDIPISSAALSKMFAWVKTSVVQPASFGSNPGMTKPTEKGGTTTPTTGIETETEPVGMATAGGRNRRLRHR